jgi:hypothetical protein
LLSSPSIFIASFDTLTVLGVGGVFIPTSRRDMTLVVSSTVVLIRFGQLLGTQKQYNVEWVYYYRLKVLL